MKLVLLVALIAFVAISSSHVYLKDDFTDTNWEKRWVVSDWKKDSGEAGEWELSAGRFYTDEDKEKGLRTKQDARFYDISTKFEDFSNKGKTLVIQFSVKHEQNIDCGGGYVKIVPAGLDQKNFKGGEGETPYNIMFGPDICGSSTRKVHLILNKKGSNHLLKKNVAAEGDEFTHLYTAVLSPDNTYKIYVDGVEKQTGSISEDWDILPPKKIKDPKESKPTDWVDEKFIDDPEDKKPEGWDDIPAEVEDPNANKPDDWDDELDGEWEAPKISNPEYKGVWSAKKIDNPLYKGEWVHPEIDNPDYADDPELYAFDSLSFLGLDIWQVKSGSIFDNFLITDDFSEAESVFEAVNARREGEKKLKEEKDKADREEAEKKAAESKDAEKPDGDDDDDDDDEKETPLKPHGANTGDDGDDDDDDDDEETLDDVADAAEASKEDL